MDGCFFPKYSTYLGWHCCILFLFLYLSCLYKNQMINISPAARTLSWFCKLPMMRRPSWRSQWHVREYKARNKCVSSLKSEKCDCKIGRSVDHLILSRDILQINYPYNKPRDITCTFYHCYYLYFLSFYHFLLHCTNLKVVDFIGQPEAYFCQKTHLMRNQFFLLRWVDGTH